MSAMSYDALTAALNAADAERLQELLPLLNESRSEWLEQALLQTSYENKPLSVRALVDVGADLSTKDSIGKTGLHWAAHRGHEQVAQVLLQASADVEAVDQDGATALHLAAEYNSGPVARLLLIHEANVLAETTDKRTPLHMAAEEGSAVAAAVILETCKGLKSKSAVDLPNDRGETALMRASSRGRAAIVPLLLSAGADGDKRDFWGQSALHFAAYSGQVAPAAVLLDAGVNVSASTQDGSTPLHVASERGHVEIVELLLARGGNVKAVSRGGFTPLHKAAERGFSGVVEALLAHKADPEARNLDGRTPLMSAASRGHRDAIARLIDGYADMDATDCTRQSAIHAAAGAGYAEVIDLLAVKRARLEDQDGSGRTPLDIAVAARQEPAIRMLMMRGAVMSEASRQLPGMEEFAQMVEAEMIREQMSQRESGAAWDELRAAEKAFEEMRQNILRLTTQIAASEVAPSLQEAELRLQDASKLAKDSAYGVDSLYGEMENLTDELKRSLVEIAEHQRAIVRIQDKITYLKSLKPGYLEDMKKLQADLAASRKRYEESMATNTDTLEKARKVQAKLPPLEEELKRLREEDDKVMEELRQARAELARWKSDIVDAHSLHVQAEKLLKRHVGASPYPKAGTAPGAAPRQQGSSEKQEKEEKEEAERMPEAQENQEN